MTLFSWLLASDIVLVGRMTLFWLTAQFACLCCYCIMPHAMFVYVGAANITCCWSFSIRLQLLRAVTPKRKKQNRTPCLMQGRPGPARGRLADLFGARGRRTPSPVDARPLMLPWPVVQRREWKRGGRSPHGRTRL